jgi:hypothetical protein
MIGKLVFVSRFYFIWFGQQFVCQIKNHFSRIGKIGL